ncbi:MAG: biotin transporter BioY [Lachnospiraceae bacterium]|nr:biotin transporter BioY [Lachnospiraceae bacterium]
MSNSEASVNRHSLSTLDLVQCGMFAALMTVGAFLKIVIPLGIYTVTFSLQFFFALLSGFLLGKRKGFLAVLVYLLVGLAGVPVFAHGGGIMYLMKPTFGFLIGFAGAAFFAGALCPKRGNISFPRLLFAAFIGEMVYYACGLVYYYLMFNFVLSNGTIAIPELISVWFLSTVVPDFVLAACAAFTARQMLPHLGAFS